MSPLSAGAYRREATLSDKKLAELQRRRDALPSPELVRQARDLDLEIMQQRSWSGFLRQRAKQLAGKN
jgi:hypothetical protein